MGARPKKLATSHPIYPLAQKKWKSSGLTDDHASLLHLRPMTGAETQALSPKFHAVGSIQIPYFDLDGKPTDFYRVRYLEPLPGLAGVVEKPQRYVQPAGTLNEVYLPPLLPVDWREIAEDPSVTIYFTEGEFKSSAAASVGLACIGLGGVDVWRSSKRGVDLLPTLREINWKSRSVVIVFDSDAAQNPNVVRAQRQLARELVTRGALPAVASLPSGPGGVKQGLDDLLVAQGEKALTEIISNAPGFPESDALWELNEEILYVKYPGLIVERNTGEKIEPGRFVAHAYANRHYPEVVVKNNVPSIKKKPLAPRWVTWEHRAEVDRIVYEPGKPKLPDGNWNCWPGWAIEPKKGDVSPWKWLLDFMFKGSPDARKWFEQWCAYPIQNPGSKMYSAVLLWSVDHGVGKGLSAYSLAAIYGSNSVEINSETLKGSFNSWAENKQFVIGDEITAGEARLDKDKLKGLVTRKDLPINKKFMPEYSIRDCINYLFTSNSPDALFVEDNDRRYFIHEILGKAEQEFYDRYDLWLNGPGSINTPGKGEGPAHLFHHLLNVDLTGFRPQGQAPITDAKRNMIMSGKSDVGMWAVQLKEDPFRTLRPLGEKVAKECEVFTPTQLLHCYDPEKVKKVTSPGMGRELVRCGFRQVNGGVPVKTKMGIIRLYAVRNPDKWMQSSPKEIAAHYESFFGPDATKF